jgi:hypothetical protein
VEFHDVTTGGVLARDPTFAPQICQGGFDISQTSTKTPGQVFDTHVKTGVAETEGERIHVNRASDENG